MLFFSTKGRIGRGRYLGYLLLTLVVTLVTIYGVGAALGIAIGVTSGGPEDAMNRAHAPSLLFGWLVAMAVMIVGALQSVKRLHDLDRPGAHYFFLWIPLYNIYLALVLLLQQGTAGANKYGSSVDA